MHVFDMENETNIFEIHICCSFKSGNHVKPKCSLLHIGVQDCGGYVRSSNPKIFCNIKEICETFFI